MSDPVPSFRGETVPPALPADRSELLQILCYLKDHLDSRLDIRQICRDNLISRSRLTGLFHEAFGCGVISCFSGMKIQAARKMIQQNRLNFSQIADALGYTSVQYFSRQFRQFTGMSPSRYADCVRAGGRRSR